MKAGLGLLVRRSLREHAFSSGITIASVGLATGLVLAVFAIQEQSLRAFAGGPLGFDAVLGARGSQLQLVLNAVFHLETSPGNIPWALYEAVERDPQVERAIPYAVGDNYRGVRIVGTVPELFSSADEESPLRIAGGGRLFDPGQREAVIGSSAARETGLVQGDTFHAYHGLVFDESARHDGEYVVTGVLEPSNTPADRVIWIPLEGVYRMEGHVLRGSGDTYEAEPGTPIPTEHRELSAVMLDLASPQAGFFLDQTINKQGRAATLAWPIGAIMADLFDKLGWAIRVLGLVAHLVVLVSAGSILASIVNTMQERRRDFAVLRALGARRRSVSAAIIGEATSIGGLGALLGFLVYAVIFALARQIVRSQTGVVLEPWIWHPVFVIAPAAVVLLAALAGAIPARQAYRTDVATHLLPPS